MVCGIPKKIVQRYFYNFKVPLTYKDIESLIKKCSDPECDVSQFPKRYTPETLIRVKRSLEDCRRHEGLVTRAGAEAESNLLEVAADMGNSTAIALLCGARMRQPDASADDLESGSELLTKLMDSQFPLAFKVSGDLAVGMGRPNEAQQFYERALEAGLEDNRLVVECLRNVGHLSFKRSQLAKSRDFFSRACMLAEDPRQVSDCHFMLAQLRESDRVASRQHLELAATYGFQNAFIPLGTMLLNWFGEARLAREWFKLAITTDTTGAALVGLFDTALQLEDWKLAKYTLVKIKMREDASTLLKARERMVQKVESHEGKIMGKPIQGKTGDNRSGRFDF